MALEALCPTCGATYNLADDMKGKTVRCKKCEHTFTVGGAGKKRDEDDGIQEKARPARGRSRDDDDRPRSRGGNRSYHDDDEDDDGKVKKTKSLEEQARKRSGSNKLPVWPFVAAGGALAGLLLVCGGVGYFMFRSKPVDQQAGGGRPPQINNPIFGGPLGNNAGGREPANIDEALKRLPDNEPDRARVAAEWLSRAPLDAGRQNEVARALEARLPDGRPEVRYASMKALKTWATKESAGPVLRAFKLEQIPGGLNEGQAGCVEVLGRFGGEEAAAALAPMLPSFFCREQAASALEKIGPVAQKDVLKFFNHQDHGCRDRARSLIASYKTSPSLVVGQCVADLTAAEQDVRQAAAQGLAQAKVLPASRKTVTLALDKAMRDTNDHIAEEAAKAMTVWADRDTLPLLLIHLQERADGPRSDRVRRECIQAVSKLKDPRSIPALATALSNSPQDRDAVVQALQAFGPAAKDEMMKLMEHPDRRVRDEARRVLQNIGVTENLDVITAISDLKNGDRVRRSGALRTLEAGPVVEAKRAEVVAALEMVVDDPSAIVVSSAVKVLAVWGTRESFPIYARLIEHTNLVVRRSVIEALGKTKDERAAKLLAGRLVDVRDRDGAARALQQLGLDRPEAVEAEMLPGLTHADKQVRLECCRVLGNVGGKASATALEKLVKSAEAAKPFPERDVATSAREALLKINLRVK